MENFKIADESQEKELYKIHRSIVREHNKSILKWMCIFVVLANILPNAFTLNNNNFKIDQAKLIFICTLATVFMMLLIILFINEIKRILIKVKLKKSHYCYSIGALVNTYKVDSGKNTTYAAKIETHNQKYSARINYKIYKEASKHNSEKKYLLVCLDNYYLAYPLEKMSNNGVHFYGDELNFNSDNLYKKSDKEALSTEAIITDEELEVYKKSIKKSFKKIILISMIVITIFEAIIVLSSITEVKTKSYSSYSWGIAITILCAFYIAPILGAIYIFRNGIKVIFANSVLCYKGTITDITSIRIGGETQNGRSNYKSYLTITTNEGNELPEIDMGENLFPLNKLTSFSIENKVIVLCAGDIFNPKKCCILVEE